METFIEINVKPDQRGKQEFEKRLKTKYLFVR